MTVNSWVVLIYAVYLPTLISLYILELFVIFRNRQLFCSRFYSIFSVTPIVDIFACLIGSVFYRLPMYSIVNGFYKDLLGQQDWIPPLHMFSYFLNALSQFLGLLMALNRFTAIFLPLRHGQIWCRRKLFFYILLCLVLSIVPSWFLLCDPVEFYPDKWEPVYVLGVVWSLEHEVWLSMALVTVVCTVLSSIVYGACMIQLCFFSKARNSKIERNFLIVGLSSLIFSIPYMAAMLYIYIDFSFDSFNALNRLNIKYQLPWLTDLKYLSLSPMLLLTNRSIRSSIMQFFRRSHVQHITDVT